MQDVPHFIEKSWNIYACACFVNDASGSLWEITAPDDPDDAVIRPLIEHTLLLYIRADAGAEEVHMRPACPPLLHSCKYLNFSRSKSELDLAARRAMREMDRGADSLEACARSDTPEHTAMVRASTDPTPTSTVTGMKALVF